MSVRTLPISHCRIQLIPQPIAHIVDRQDGERDGEARKKGNPDRVKDQALAFANHETPVGRGRLRHRTPKRQSPSADRWVDELHALRGEAAEPVALEPLELRHDVAFRRSPCHEVEDRALNQALCGGIPLSEPESVGTRPDDPEEKTEPGFNIGAWFAASVWKHISAVDGQRCPSEPTCSSYSAQVFRRNKLYS